MKELSSGAEAVVYLDEEKDQIIKKRVNKKYRHPELDGKLLKSRHNREVKVLKKLNDFNSPELILNNKDESIIVMEYIIGDKLSRTLENLDYNKVATDIGKILKKLHDMNIIHGDLTTSNMILRRHDKRLFFIDFGLSFFSDKAEDKAVDLHLLKQALMSKHYTIGQECFDLIIKNYNDKIVLNRLLKVEERGRNKKK